ncbi:MAG: hypothetical protein F9K22_00100 [Bacteroidetes bacterium]|nr:MAG: hypothetical protein F9K22_00100 [Bacteroidota bacterium]
MKKLIVALALLTVAARAQWYPEQQAERERTASAIQRASALQPKHPSRLLARAKESGSAPLWKSGSQADRKYFLMNGNLIVGNIYNYGGISPGDGLVRHVNNMVWRGLGDIYQFGPIVAAEVTDTSGKVIHISSDAINDTYARDFNPSNNTILYAWQPLPDYADPASPVMASSGALDLSPRDGKPDSWPRQWYNPSKGQYVWPGYLRQDVPNADLEVLWGMDDRENDEFAYFPFGTDTIDATLNKPIRGLGVKMEGRALQWSNALAQNTIFFVYTAQNYSTRDLSDVYFGMYGDIDVGGGSPENQDDLGFFISPLDTVIRGTTTPIPLYSRNIVYLWDNDFKGELGLRTHYTACKFLESPGNPNDGKDNDGDNLSDESQTNGLDDDGDWRAASDDVGIDGVPETGDFGENDGIPTPGVKRADGTVDELRPGEPNFELTDLDESDQIGLTSFRSWRWTERLLRDDEATWYLLDSGFVDNSIPNFSDVIFQYGSGRIRLNKRGTDGSIKRFSIALLMGVDLNDLLTTAQTVQLIYNQNYQFYRPPDKPTVVAVPGDKKVTLYWDNVAESSVDPIAGEDFEGYVIYRSTDPQFSDINTVTDGKGTPILYAPLTNSIGVEAKFDIAKRPEPWTDINNNKKYDGGEPYVDVNLNGKWDAVIEDYWKGYSPVAYADRGVKYYLGDNTGLVHMYVDSNNVINGQTYYYAVVAYDHGDSLKVPPTETTKRINIDPITSQLIFDHNTVQVVPGPRVSGYIDATLTGTGPNRLSRESGTGTGFVGISIIDDLAVKDQASYRLEFRDSLKTGSTTAAQLNYFILKLTPETYTTTLIDTNFVKMGVTHLSDDSVLTVVNTATGQVYIKETDFVVDTLRGLFRKTATGAMSSLEGPFTITYRRYPQPASTYLNMEEANPVFDGMKLFVRNEPLSMDSLRSRFIIDQKKIGFVVNKPSIGVEKVAPLDIQIQFNRLDTNASGAYLFPGDTMLNTSVQKRIQTPFKVVNNTNDPVRAAIPIEAIVRENRVNNKWEYGEAIVFRTPPPYRTVSNNTMFQVTFTLKDSSYVAGGEVFQFLTRQPFNSSDKFTFTTAAGRFSPELASRQLDRIRVVPNPYVAVNDIEPTDRLPGTTRGSRRIYFEHLPALCTIRIFTLSGELVRELHHSSNVDNGREYWDLLNRDNLGVAYGVYFAHIDAPGVGEKIVKFALIK